jgi:hypothetical protein
VEDHGPLFQRKEYRMPRYLPGRPPQCSGPRVNPTITIPADGNPGPAPTFNGYKLAFDEIAAPKQRVAYLADGVQAKAWALVNVNAGTVTVP